MFGAVVCLFLDCLPLIFGAAVFIEDFDICLFSANRFDFLRPLDSTNIMHFCTLMPYLKVIISMLSQCLGKSIGLKSVSHLRRPDGQLINQQICLCVSFKYYTFWALNCYLMKKNSSIFVLNLNILKFLYLYTELFVLGGTYSLKMALAIKAS